LNLFAALAHPIRERILQILEAERLLPYKDLMEKLGIKETGVLNYHLQKLQGLIEKRGRLYSLTPAGRNAVRLMQVKDQLMAGERVELGEVEAPIVSRIGVIICSCGDEISRTINIGELMEKVGSFPGVVRTRLFSRLCMLENIADLKGWCQRHFLNSVVIAACSPQLHREMFSAISEQLDLPVEFANIREQCAWVHGKDSHSATQKALLLVRAATEMLQHRVPSPKRLLSIRKSVAIIGGGLAGLTAAEVLSKSDNEVILLERGPSLGGVAAHWERIYGSIDCAPCALAEITSRIVLSRNTRVLTDTEVTGVSGEIGNYEITATRYPRFVDLNSCTMCGSCIKICPQSRPNEHDFGLTKRKFIYLPFASAYPYKPVINSSEIEFCRTCRKCEEVCPSHAINLDQQPTTMKFTVGAIILATGADIPDPQSLKQMDSLQYDPKRDIIASYEFERMLASDGPTGGEIIRPSSGRPAKSIAVIQCINVIDACSGYCCNVARKYIDIIKQNHPEITINVLYEKSRLPEDRTACIREDGHTHTCKEMRVVRRGRRRVIETDVGVFPADLIVLNVGMVPSHQLQSLQKVIGFSLDNRGFINPVSLPSGIWACGSATGPKTFHELVRDARNAALEAILLLGKESLSTGERTIRVDQAKCGLCNLCVEVCPYNAISLGEEGLLVDDFKCKGCGICAAVCPTGAISSTPTREEVQAAINALSHGLTPPRILVFCCESCGYPAIDNAGVRGVEYHPGAVALPVPCTGRLDANFVVEALRRGFDGVMVVGCNETSCRYLDGIQKAAKRINVLANFFGDELRRRVRIVNVSAVEGHKFAESVNQFASELRRMEA